MGAWGVGILENDSTVDYLITINTLWKLKIDKEQIQQILQKKYLQEGDQMLEYNIDTYTEFWTAIAFAEWFYDRPSKVVIDKIERIITSNQRFYDWAEPDEPDERMESINNFFQALKTPRLNNEKRIWKIWFWENRTDIIDNEYSETLSNEYRLLKRLGVKNIIEILLSKYHPLTEDFEEAIFWSTIAMCEKEIGTISKKVAQEIDRIEKNPNSMNVIKVAYNSQHRDEIMSSIRKTMNDKD